MKQFQLYLILLRMRCHGKSVEQDTPPVTVGLTFPLPMAPAPVIPAAPPPLVGGPVAVPDSYC